MKAIYDAARALLYPKHAENATGVAFAHGINSYRPAMRQALVAFEHANRGHRHLLGGPELSLAHAGRPAGPYSAQHYQSMRAKLRDTTYALARAVLQGDPHPPMAPLKALLATPDTSGWIAHFIKGELYHLGLFSAALGLHKDFYVVSDIDVEESKVSIRITVHDKLTSAVAARTLAPIGAAATTLGGLAPLMRGARVALQQVLADVPSWPEFAKRAEEIANICD